MKKYVLLFILFSGYFCNSHAQSEVSISGKLRTLRPIVLRLESLDGEVIFSVDVDRQGEFNTGKKVLPPDVYRMVIDRASQDIYLDGAVTVKGFYDNNNPANSSLSFEGIDAHLQICKWLPEDIKSAKKTVDPTVGQHLMPTMLSALAYLADIPVYEPNKILLDMIPETERNTLSALWLQNRVDSLARYVVGAEAYDFAFVDPNGKEVKLSDFRGKFVLVDFWASWCAPCRQEMKSLRPIYEELMGDDLVFISISMDNLEKDWRAMMAEENLPWVMLWNSEGFPSGGRHGTIQKAYGFYGIPFIVLIDKDGCVIYRDLRGEQVKTAIIEARSKVIGKTV